MDVAFTLMITTSNQMQLLTLSLSGSCYRHISSIYVLLYTWTKDPIYQ